MEPHLLWFVRSFSFCKDFVAADQVGEFVMPHNHVSHNELSSAYFSIAVSGCNEPHFYLHRFSYGKSMFIFCLISLPSGSKCCTLQEVIVASIDEFTHWANDHVSIIGCTIVGVQHVLGENFLQVLCLQTSYSVSFLMLGQ